MNMIIPVIMPPHIAGMKFQNDIFFICEISGSADFPGW